MQKFINYLVKEGFEIKHKQKSVDFSTMGDIRKYYEKGDIKIIIGLHEAGKPPTLIHPRPKIRVRKTNENSEYRYTMFNQGFDDAMNICLRNETPEKIFKALFDNTIKFEYEF